MKLAALITRFLPIVAVLFLTCVLAACAQQASAPQNIPGSGSTSTTSNSTPASGSAGNGNALIHTSTATVKGASTTILTNAQGMTLYYFTPDTPAKSACTGGCAGTWPALIASGSGAPTSSPALSGTLSVASAGNGNQVEYNGHLLYTFSGDSAAGQTNGEGVGGKWFVATPNLK